MATHRRPNKNFFAGGLYLYGSHEKSDPDLVWRKTSPIVSTAEIAEALSVTPLLHHFTL